jgi:glycosyltransferase involved in cell wall biosynthesis
MRAIDITGVKQTFGTPSVKIKPGRWYEVGVDITFDQALLGYRLQKLTLEFDENDQELLWKEASDTHILWNSPFSMGDGYATAAENMVHALVRQGVKLHIQQCWFVDRKGLLPETVKMLNEPMPGFMRVGICMATPGEFRKLPTPYRIGLTMYEADNPIHPRAHPEWKHDCNHVDMIVVPSEYCEEVFGNFVNVPIKVAELAVNPIYYVPTLRKPKDTFTFVTYGTLNGRKSPFETVDCFKKAFPREQYPDARLVLKTRLGTFGWGQDQPPGDLGDPRITVVDTYSRGLVLDWTPYEMRDWLLGADCMIFLSKGEGYGMPPREAMCTGLPVIFANHTGMESMADKRYNWPIRTHHKEASPLGGDWRIPDWDQAIDTMRWVYHHREEAYQKGYEAGEWFVTNHGADQAAGQLKAILDDVDPSSSQRPGRPHAESISGPIIRNHHRFYQKIADSVSEHAVLLDVGVGEGVAYAALTKMGFRVWGIVSRVRLASTKEKLERKGIEARLVEWDLIKIDKMALKHLGVSFPELAFSQGVLQERSDNAMKLILQAMKRCAGKVMFSMPSVFFPNYFSKGSRMMRLDELRHRLLGLEAPVEYYGKGHRYIMGEYIGPGIRARGPVVQKGWLKEDVWRPFSLEADQ